MNHKNERQIAFIDSRVRDLTQLSSGLVSNTRLFIVEPDKNGLGQIARALEAGGTYDAIHIISHASPGYLLLGKDRLDRTGLIAHRAELATLSSHLAAGGEIVLYGCDLAQGDAGQRFVSELASLTGANIAASSFPVGAVSQGAEWGFDYRIGSPVAQPVFTEPTRAAYRHAFGGFSAHIDPTALSGAEGFRLYGENADDNLGRSVAIIGDWNGDGVDDWAVGATGMEGSQGQVYVVFGQSGNYASPLDVSSLNGSNGFTLTNDSASSNSSERLGWAIQSAGDVNGDGLDDLLVGAHYEYDGGRHGAAYLLYGRSSGFYANVDISEMNGSNGTRFYDENSGYLGESVSRAGDINGDGIDDLILGSPGNDGYSGSSYIVFGKSGGFGAEFDLSTLNGSDGFLLDGDRKFGTSVAGIGDINGDGIDDLAAGAHEIDGYAGAGFVLFGSNSAFSSTLDVTTGLNGSNGFRLSGADGYDAAGYSIAGAGDVNGDGIDDLIIGASAAENPSDAGTGAAYVVFGKTTGFSSNVNLGSLNGSNGFGMYGVFNGGSTGTAVSAAGDVNGDGIDDLIVGAYNERPDRDKTGAAYVVFGRKSGFAKDLYLGNLDGNDGFTIQGGNEYDKLGDKNAVGGGGDINGDGIDDVIVGAWGDDTTDGNAGAAYVVYGQKAPQLNFEGSADDDILIGNEEDNVMKGYAGEDILIGRKGNDNLQGGTDDDVLIGGSGNDLLNGGGGIDVMTGKRGNDTYLVDRLSDQVVELPGQGNDTVKSTSSYRLGENIEKLVLTGGKKRNATGNSGANTISGNRVANVLSGLEGNDKLYGGKGNDRLYGGAGRDTLTAGSGADRFCIQNKSEGIDTVTDFSRSSRDKIELQRANFGNLPKGTLAARYFRSNTKGLAMDKDDRLVFNTTNDTLYFDPDGSGSKAAVALVKFKNNINLARQDIVCA